MTPYDADTGAPLTPEQALCAADNPEIYRWVVWADTTTT